jgi:hypothetical protein
LFSQDSAAPTAGSSTTPDQTTEPDADTDTRTAPTIRRRRPEHAQGPRKKIRDNPPMFWESEDRSLREDLTERPAPPECLRGILTTDYTPSAPPEIDIRRRRQRERTAVRSPFAPRGGAR